MRTLTEWEGNLNDNSIKYDLLIPENDLLIDQVDVSSVSEELFDKEFSTEEEVSCLRLNKSEKADKIDYEIAVACGLLSGLVDSLWVGEFNLQRANEWGKEEVEKYVIAVAKKTGYKKGDLEGAIKHLEGIAPFVGDKYKDKYGGGLQHHIRDFGHHFSIFGLAFSLITQFTGKCYGTKTDGTLLKVDVEQVYMEDSILIGKNVPEKIFLGTIQWYLHIVSDMAGSRDYAGQGTGIPGPIVSSMKMMATLPLFKEINKKGYKKASVIVQKLFDGTLIEIKDENGKNVRFDLRQEIGILHEIGRQTRPVIINECLVRALFSIRRIHKEIQALDIHSMRDLGKADFKKAIPWNNRALQRMLTVSTGTFEVVDICDAAIRGAIKNKGVNNIGFAKDFIIRLNFVGIGRFAIAVKNDGRYIVEDIAEYKEKVQRQKVEDNKKTREFEKSISKIEAFALTDNQYKILNSLKLETIDYDISMTDKDSEKEKKLKWKKAWIDNLAVGVSKQIPIESLTLKNETQIYSQIYLECAKENSLVWLYVITMELLAFRPYFLLNDEDDKNYKGLKVRSDYLEDVFVKKQDFISEDVLNELRKSGRKAFNIITGKNNKAIIGVASIGALVALTGGLASAFAPEIAVALVGESFVGLSGAALTNASLALLGGGSLAAGGMGMAGGAAVITGGASILGMAGGTGVATTIALLSNEGFAATECAKLYSLSKTILLETYGAVAIVANIAELISYRVNELEKECDRLKGIEVEDNEEKKKTETQIKIIGKNLKYYKKCSAELVKLVCKYYNKQELLLTSAM